MTRSDFPAPRPQYVAALLHITAEVSVWAATLVYLGRLAGTSTTALHPERRLLLCFILAHKFVSDYPVTMESYARCARGVHSSELVAQTFCVLRALDWRLGLDLEELHRRICALQKRD